jgi:ADP-heptose:LPS heptosyltransferase
VTRDRGKILVIRGGAIGDFILTLPVFAALRENFPQTQLAVLAYPHIAGLALAGELVDEVHSIEARALAGFFARAGTLDRALGEYFAGASIVLSYLYDPDHIFHENVARVSKAQFIAGPHRPEEHGKLHATEVFLKPLERLAIFAPDPVPRLPLPEAADPKLSYGHWLALHPGSGSPRKNWPEQKWAELLRWLTNETGWNFLLIGGEAEEGRHRRLAASLPAARCHLADRLPLPELAHLLRECHAYLGHDSGISHLAAAIGLPSVVLWGETAERIWRPPGEHVTLVQSPEGLNGMAVGVVRAALEAVFEEI